MKKERKSRAFVLVEVIVSFLILAEVLVLFFSSYTASLKMLTETKRTFEQERFLDAAFATLLERLHTHAIDMSAFPKDRLEGVLSISGAPAEATYRYRILKPTKLPRDKESFVVQITISSPAVARPYFFFLSKG